MESSILRFIWSGRKHWNVILGTRIHRRPINSNLLSLNSLKVQHISWWVFKLKKFVKGKARLQHGVNLRRHWGANIFLITMYNSMFNGVIANFYWQLNMFITKNLDTEQTILKISQKRRHKRMTVEKSEWPKGSLAKWWAGSMGVDKSMRQRKCNRHRHGLQWVVMQWPVNGSVGNWKKPPLGLIQINTG